MPTSYDQQPIIRRALISVSDKRGLDDLARFLDAQGVQMISTGGTAKYLRGLGFTVENVESLTGFPEIMDGRVKTLHPKIHGALLARRDEADHKTAMQDHDIQAIDLAIINLYPFEQTIQKTDDLRTCIENIDIGGPAMIRASSKNHDFVTVMVSPDDYPALQQEMSENNGATRQSFRKKMALQAFSHTASYDAAIADWMQGYAQADPNTLGTNLIIHAKRLGEGLRYGENPHQKAALYRFGQARPGVSTAQQLQGKDLSYNNLNDADAAFELVAEFSRPAVAIIKHANPCGVAEADTLATAYARAKATDPTSAFGGIVAVNKSLDKATAAAIIDVFAEVVIAPAIDPDAKAVLATKKNLRVLITGELPDPKAGGKTLRSIAGGLLVQDRDSGHIARDDLKVVTKRAPSDSEIEDMIFAFQIAKHVKSNAIVYAKDQATLGIGAGQMSRIDSARIAALKAEDALGKDSLKGCVVASDAFFPFADGLLAAAKAGASAVIQPGGSIRDDTVIQAADEAGLAMVLTGMRHFRH